MKKKFFLLLSLWYLSILPTNTPMSDVPLIQALNDGNLVFAKKILEQGADPKLIKEFGSTALTQAIIKKDQGLTLFLLDHGVDLFAPNSNGNIPWLIALEVNDEEFLQFLRKYQPKKKDMILGAAVHNYASGTEKG